MSWLVVNIPIPETVSEVLAEALRAAGADGVSEEWQEGVTSVHGFWKDASEETVTAATDLALQRLIDAGLLMSPPTYTITAMEDQDWLIGWKQYFSPLEISPRLLVTPSWEAVTPQPGQAVIVLDPGMAFGTGTHGTTFTCLQALSEYLQPQMKVCDVGTGSGILAIAAVKLGATSVVATDNDALSIRVARENAERNQVSEGIDFRISDLLTDVDGPFDLVVANILAPVILALIPQLARVLQPGGLFVSSGYITSQEADIRTALEAAGHRILTRYQRNEWITLVSSAA